MAKKSAPRFLVFSSLGTAHWLTASSWSELHQPSPALFCACPWDSVDESDMTCVCQITKQGAVKCTYINEFRHATRKSGIRSIDLDDGDSLVAVFAIKSDGFIVVATRHGKVKRFHSDELGRSPRLESGVRAIRLEEKLGETTDSVCDAFFVPEGLESTTVVGLITENGFAARFLLSDITCVHRFHPGVQAVRLTPQSGSTVVAVPANSGTAIPMLTSGTTRAIPNWAIPNWDDVPIRRRIARLAPIPLLRRTPILAIVQRSHEDVIATALTTTGIDSESLES